MEGRSEGRDAGGISRHAMTGAGSAAFASIAGFRPTPTDRSGANTTAGAA